MEIFRSMHIFNKHGMFDESMFGLEILACYHLVLFRHLWPQLINTSFLRGMSNGQVVNHKLSDQSFRAVVV